MFGDLGHLSRLGFQKLPGLLTWELRGNKGIHCKGLGFRV